MAIGIIREEHLAIRNELLSLYYYCPTKFIVVADTKHTRGLLEVARISFLYYCSASLHVNQ